MTQEIEIVGAKESEAKALEIIQQSELSSDEATSLKNALTPYFEQADEWVTKARTLKVTDESQVTEMLEARKARLALKDIRVNLEKKRKELKEESLRKGKAIDGMANILKFLIEPIEDYLEKQEKFVEIRETERKAKLEADRKAILEQNGVDTAFYDLKEMPQDTFDQLVLQAQESKRLRQEAEDRAEKERQAREQKEAEEREAQRAENARLKAEAEAREAELKKEREAKAKLEREAKEKEEAEAKEKARIEAEKKAEEKRLKDEEKRKAKMSDTDKVKSIIDTLKAIRFPEMKSDDAKALVDELEMDIAKMITKINNY